MRTSSLITLAFASASFGAVIKREDAVVCGGKPFYYIRGELRCIGQPAPTVLPVPNPDPTPVSKRDDAALCDGKAHYFIRGVLHCIGEPTPTVLPVQTPEPTSGPCDGSPFICIGGPTEPIFVDPLIPTCENGTVPVTSDNGKNWDCAFVDPITKTGNSKRETGPCGGMPLIMILGEPRCLGDATTKPVMPTCGAGGKPVTKDGGKTYVCAYVNPVVKGSNCPTGATAVTQDDGKTFVCIFVDPVQKGN